MIRVSVIVPMCNAAATLGACLDALLQQDVPRDSYELILVDNGSADDSVAIARRRPAVRLLSETRQSAYAARNLGISAATGGLIAFIDADCVARPDWLRRLQQRLADTPGAQVVMGRDWPGGTSTAVRLLADYDHFKELFVMSSADPAVYYGHTNCMLARREVFDQLGPFDERPRGADVIFVQRVLERHGTEAVQYQPDAVVEHKEISSALVYFKKAFIYGRSARSYQRVVPARPLRNAERRRIFRNLVRACKLPPWQGAYLLALLVIGVAAYNLGWRSLPSRGGISTVISANRHGMDA